MICYLLIGLISFIIGFIIYIKYPEPKLNDFLNYETFYPVFARNKRCRYFGIILMVIGLVLLIYSGYLYFYSESNDFIKINNGNLSNSCKNCQQFSDRRKLLKPFSLDEYSILEKYALDCNKCSSECANDILLAERNAKLGGFPVSQNDKQKCIETTKEAILAKQQLERLAEKGVKKILAVEKFKKELV